MAALARRTGVILHRMWIEGTDFRFDERQLDFEDLSIALAEVEAEKETRAAKAGDAATRLCRSARSAICSPGYRRITALLREAGWAVNVKRVERIWRQEGLKVPQKQPEEGSALAG